LLVLTTSSEYYLFLAGLESSNELGDFKGVGHFLRLNFRSKGYVSLQYLWAVRYGNGYTTTLLLEFFTQKHFAADFIRLKLHFIKKHKNHFFSHPLGVLGVTCTLLQLVGKPVDNFPFITIVLFSLSLTVDMTSVNIF